MMRKVLMLSLLVSIALVNLQCNASRKVKGAVIGATAGGVVGGVIAKNNRAVGVLVGAAIGGTAGALIGNYMDKQAEEIRKDLEGAKVERIGEGILITFDSGLLFNIDSYALRAETKNNLDNLAKTLNKYDGTDILVMGHTDNTGTVAYNLELSKKRAASVDEYLRQDAVAGKRLDTEGMGESDPIVSNDTAAGRQQNRRVEVILTANKKIIRAAKRGDIPVEG
ncbi:MAG TPA: OmpA family protein [Saprospiraceae bacterium]|nr:OmpA family protein [Saprospiraceae bacterium]MCB9272113.1 OmpA family protein [Lewinellaceae bacterium]HPG06504.1 OmpA family protein [Saprospiraceae bacterium]HRV83969.1 OmpA family protein [Saprospiraceae bacterium]